MNIEQYAEGANAFLNKVGEELGYPQDKARTLRITKSVLHALRETISPEESCHLMAQLPMLLKGIYVDGWTLHPKHKVRSMDDFLTALRSMNPRTSAEDFGNDDQAIERTKCVFNVVKEQVSTGEIQDIIDQFPTDLVGLWITDAQFSKK
jgi:uncharacterized protein (DUF2267 family)